MSTKSKTANVVETAMMTGLLFSGILSMKETVKFLYFTSPGKPTFH
jgi:hypothetical protein